jgi:ATP-dependent Clp protease, protease subunit
LQILLDVGIMIRNRTVAVQEAYMPEHVPTVIQPAARGDRAFDIYSRLLEDRIVILGSELDDVVANLITAQLLHLEAEGPEKDINLYINSPGGSGTALLAIYDTMQHIGSEVSTICLGQAASAAAVLLGAGAPGKRFALPHARILIHQPHGHIGGQAADMEIHAREVLRQRRLIAEILARHTGQTLEKISEDTDRDFILTAEDARGYGLVDEVVPARRLAGFRPAPPSSNGR